MPEEVSEHSDESELEAEVRRIIGEDNSEDALNGLDGGKIIYADNSEELAKRRKEKIKRINSYKRDFVIYSVLGCVDTIIASNFLLASIVPLKFGNIPYSGILIGGAVVNTAISCYLFRTAANKLESIVEEKKKYY